MKKKIISICLVVALLAVGIVGATLAYFTDTDSKTNTFTVGNVDIALIESSLHRENAAGREELASDTEMQGSGNTSEYKKADNFYTDAQIWENAASYSCTDIKLNPGESYHKMPYVANTGKNDAYIRIRVLVPAELDDTILSSSLYTGSAMDTSEFVLTTDKTGTVTRTVDNKEIYFNVYTFTRTAALAPNEMTYWNVWGTVAMDSDVTNEEIANYFGTGKTFEGGTFPVLVEADAIQADSFDSYTAAWTAFDVK